MRQLKIELSELELAFDSGSEMNSYYLDFPAERERWFQFKREQLLLRILDWLEAHGITPLQ